MPAFSSMPTKFVMGLVQHRCSPDVAANRVKALDMTRQAANGGAALVCLQELYSSQYFCQEECAELFDLAEPLDGPSVQAFSKLCKELKIVVVVPIFEKRDLGLYHNSAVVIEADGSVAGVYRKMHIPDDPLFYEKFYFTPGDLGFRTIRTSVVDLGVLICWDQWFPEGARATALQGAKLLCYPTAIGWHHTEKKDFGETQHGAWEVSMRAHAVANGVWVAAPNRVGVEGGLEFWGQSFVCEPSGRIATRASVGNEEVLLHEIDLGDIERQRRGWPFLRDRRIDAYDGLLKRYGA